jgi:hypothetical protein
MLQLCKEHAHSEQCSVPIPCHQTHCMSVHPPPTLPCLPVSEVNARCCAKITNIPARHTSTNMGLVRHTLLCLILCRHKQEVFLATSSPRWCCQLPSPHPPPDGSCRSAINSPLPMGWCSVDKSWGLAHAAPHSPRPPHPNTRPPTPSTHT